MRFSTGMQSYYFSIRIRIESWMGQAMLPARQKRQRHFYNEGIHKMPLALLLFVGGALRAYYIFQNNDLGADRRYMDSRQKVVLYVFDVSVIGSAYGLGSIINNLVRKWVKRRARNNPNQIPEQNAERPSKTMR